MSVSFELEAVSRSDTGKGASRRLRKTGMVPGIVYGAGKDPEMISVAHNELIQHLDHEAFYSHILTLNVDGGSQKVVLKDLHRHPAKPFIIHLDLLRVSDDEKIKMHVPLHFLNETKAVGVKAGGQLSREITDVEISCFPKDLPEFIEVDVMDLDVGESIHLSEVKLPEGVEILQLGLGEDYDSAVVAIHAIRGSAEDEEGQVVAEEGGEAPAEE
jgi:large subunit ribosomal protein L25